MAKSPKSAKPTKKTAAKKAPAKPAKAASAKKTPVSPTPPLGRETLPIPDPQHVGLTTYDARDPKTTYPPITMLRPPAGAPNVLIVLIDDVGFAASSAFGGPCKTPVAERLAANGLKLNRFHTTALCSPTRQALLTGRNHHSVGMGGITEIATAAPGYSSVRPKDKAPIAETLRLNGYSTSQFGKCHEVPVWEVSPVGPFSQWPTGSGFEHFYGFIGGEANQYYPGLYEGTTPVEPEKSPEEGYTLTEDLTDRAITWVRQQKVLSPDKPFFMYYAPGATHAPHHVPKVWSDKYTGKFDEGWDALREKIFARQKKLGVIPKDAELTGRHDEIPGWDDMPAELKPVLARQMEIYAGFLEQTDYEVGRLIDAIGDLGVLEDTLIYYILGDNGASAEGTPNGCFNEMCTLNGLAGSRPPSSCCPRSTTSALPTPTTITRLAGRTHCVLRTSGPNRWRRTGVARAMAHRALAEWHSPTKEVSRNQFHHVIDVAPTILEAAGLPAPISVNGIQQAPIEGVSMIGTLRDGAAPEPTMFSTSRCSAIEASTWMGGRRSPSTAPRGWPTSRPLDDDVWELYAPDDWTQARNLAADDPAKLAELQRLWLIEAVKYNVVPLDDRCVRALQPRHCRAPSTDPRQQPTAVLRDAGQRELRAQHQEQVALGDRQCHRAEGVSTA